MNQQKFFKFETKHDLDLSSFFVNETNKQAFSLVNRQNLKENIFLIGPKKSGAQLEGSK